MPSQLGQPGRSGRSGRRARPRRPRDGRLARIVAALVALVVVAGGTAACSFADGSGSSSQPAASATPVPAGVTFSADPNAQPPVVTTTGGEISGVREGRVDHYRGIPFAAPPVGALRWAAPQPPAPWSGTRDGGEAGAACTQIGTLGTQTGEDCLYLSVTRPAGAPATARLPVVFWIHGGAFVGGSGDAVDPDAMATDGPAIVVTTNYRLGALGYLVLPSLIQGGGGDAGNYATQDLIAALRWVQGNAAAFGGDPTKVTIMGESAGSINVCALLAAPAAKGLYQRAIMQSGPCTWKLPTLVSAAQTGLNLANRLGCVDPATAEFCLRFKPAEEIMAAATVDGEIFNAFPFSPAVGGKTLPLTPTQALWNGQLADVPLLMGTIQDEGRPFTAYWRAFGPITDLGVDGMIRDRFPDRADRVLAAYPASQIPARERLSMIITDSMFTCQATTFAQLTAAIAQRPTYLYEFDIPDYPSVSPEFGAGATHGWDINYLFPPATGSTLSTPARQALSKTMIDYWVRFAATGDPNGSGENGGTNSPANWPRFDAKAVHSGNDRLLLTPQRVAPVSGTWSRHHCDVWS
ncbi:carboxylesterase/lipase family protein [Frankia nepalensis]|uniref:carboxylesterase/lipase family protein n=1 Tax=Frankia nepalensis TaxID=1836974 RepID=UPI0027DC7DC1|nr:carboxylesterase family protein [Frankia nepalensis]